MKKPQQLKVTIELIPETSLLRNPWCDDLWNVISQKERDKIRKKSSTSYKCAICGAEGKLNRCEVWSYNVDSHAQKLEGFIALCDLCHRDKQIEKELAEFREKLERERELDSEGAFKRFIREKEEKRREFPGRFVHADIMAEGYRIERQAKQILITEGFEIIDLSAYCNLHFIPSHWDNIRVYDDCPIHRLYADLCDFVVWYSTREYDYCPIHRLYLTSDYFCKKEGRYFVIDVKNKQLSNDRTKRYFYVTKNEIRDYDRLEDDGYCEVKILAVVKQAELFLYKFFNWHDFIIPEGFFRGKYGNTVRVKLKKDFDLSEFKIYQP